ncbi:MAG: AAA family ATPase [Clostridia bacterium]|nr:AAA family ATPase [Clostridia bacterium]
MYINSLTLASDSAEINFIKDLKQTCYNGVYPFKIFPIKDLRHIDFAPITIFYGGNGSGKTTLLNILAEKTGVTRHSAFNSSPFFEKYTSMCYLDAGKIPMKSQILTSDDVTDYLLNMRNLNDGIDAQREKLFSEYLDKKYRHVQLSSMADYDDLKETINARKKSQSQYVRENLMRNVDMQSNGETAMKYYVERITDNALYLIDEPENSLSASRQKELTEFLVESARFFGCQFVIATHSPFFLAMKGARIYNLDEYPAKVCKWTELENVRTYFDFFKEHESEFN